MAKSVKRNRRSSNNTRRSSNNTRRNSNNNTRRNTNNSRRNSNNNKRNKRKSQKSKKQKKGKSKNNSKVQRGCMRGGHLASYRYHQDQGFLNRINPNAHSKPLTYFADNVVEDHSNQYSLSH